MPEEEKQRRREESTRLKEEGNEQFKKGDYIEAESSYSQALQMCPSCFQKDRSILFSNRAAARMKQDKKDMAISDCSKAIQLNPSYIRAILRRAELYEKTDKLDEALEDYKSVLEKDPSVHQAREACMRLPKQIEERNERLKEEMLGKLKDLGNLVLRPLGSPQKISRSNRILPLAPTLSILSKIQITTDNKDNNSVKSCLEIVCCLLLTRSKACQYLTFQSRLSKGKAVQ